MIVRISTNENRKCPLCPQPLNGVDEFERACNHILQVHESKSLHVGQETHPDDRGNPWHSTVAVFEVKD